MSRLLNVTPVERCARGPKRAHPVRVTPRITWLLASIVVIGCSNESTVWPYADSAREAVFLPIARAAPYDRAMARALLRAIFLLLTTASVGCLYADVHAPLSYGSATPGDANGNLGAVVH